MAINDLVVVKDEGNEESSDETKKGFASELDRVGGIIEALSHLRRSRYFKIFRQIVKDEEESVAENGVHSEKDPPLLYRAQGASGVIASVFDLDGKIEMYTAQFNEIKRQLDMLNTSEHK